MKDDTVQGLKSLLVSTTGELTESKARFVRDCGALGEEMGKRQRAERDRDEALALARRVHAECGPINRGA